MQGAPDENSRLQAFFGAMPGDDRVLIDWEPMDAWFDHLSRQYDTLVSEIVGESTNGLDLRLLIISSADTIQELEAIRAQRLESVQNPTLTAPSRKPVVLITAGIHATEVGGVQMMPELVRDLASSLAFESVREGVITLIVPTLNPDGMALVHDWYRNTLNTPSEGTSPPALYHQYAGHDNNRDWYQLRLQETQDIVRNVLNVWFPHVVIDLHQMGLYAPRYVLPPYVEPMEPHVHPLLAQLGSALGNHVATEHTRSGHGGVSSGVMFDCYSPSRAYCHYHGGVRLLAEAASARIASPMYLDPDEQYSWEHHDPAIPSVHAPLPWSGSQWHLSDIITYHRTTVVSILENVARNADQWVADQDRVFIDNLASEAGTFVIAPAATQIDPAATRELIELLLAGFVDVRVATDSEFAGSFIVDTRQSFGSFAAALLGYTHYPNGKGAYDITSHCLPIHMGVDVEHYLESLTIETRAINHDDLHPFQAARAADIEPNVWLAVDARSHASVRLINQSLKAGAEVRRLVKPARSRNRFLSTGTWLIADRSAWDMRAHAATLDIRTWIVDPLPAESLRIRAPRLAIYDPQHVGASDYGWLTLWCERAGFSFAVVTSEDIVHGALAGVDTLLVPHAPAEIIRDAHRYPQYPKAYSHGFSDRVISQLRLWIHRGGHVIAFDGAAEALAEKLHLELRQPLASKKLKRAFASSGVVLRVDPVEKSELMLGIDEPFPVMHSGTAAYELSNTERQYAAARFARNELVMSGAVRGEEHLQGLAAILQYPLSEGAFTAFAFRPHFRTQMLASEQPLVNAIFMHHMHPGENRD